MTGDYPARPSRRQGRGERYAEGRGRHVDGRGYKDVGRGGQKLAPSFRLFFAVEIPEEAVRQLADWQRLYLCSDRGFRMVPEGQLHITLAFLGQKGEQEKELAAGQLEIIAGSKAFEVACTGLIGLPKDRTLRVIAAVCEEPSGRLMAIRDQLVSALAEKDLYEREKRPYFPHVTIARARGLTLFDPKNINADTIKFTAVRATLSNSFLKPTRTLHDAL